MYTSNLYQAMLADATLYAAWEKVRDNDGMPGVDGVSLEQFGEKLFSRLISLRDSVQTGHYRPQPLLQVTLERPGKKDRHLAVPTVRDRILQTAAARVLAPVLEQEFEHCSYAYRAGRSVPMAVARVAHYRDQGYRWVVDADISSFFDNIDHETLLTKLRRTLPDHSLLPLIELWLAAVIHSPGRQPRLLTKGVAQGSPLSPLLANLYLDELDEALLENDLRLVRFADDFVILCRRLGDAEAALELTENVIESLRLNLNPDKTRIVHFDAGFRFLGVDFIRNLLRPANPEAAPWVMPHDHHHAELEAGEPLPDSHPPPEENDTVILPALGRTAVGSPDLNSGEGAGEEYLELVDLPELEPLQRSLYLLGQGCWLLKENDRLVVARDREAIASIPLGKLDQIVIQGNDLVSTALLRHCARHGIAVYFCEHGGQTRATVGPLVQTKVEILRAQVQREKEDDFRLMLAGAFIAGKLHNSLMLLRRYNRRRKLAGVEEAMRKLGETIESLPKARTLDSLRGMEGIGARYYFMGLAELLAPDWEFAKRRKHPATDPINSLLSYGYAVLYQSVASLAQRQGLNPLFGNLHSPGSGHDALASDLMEEFRAPIVDSVILHLTLSKEISPQDFSYEGENGLPCKIGEQARKHLIARLEAKFRSGVIHPRIGLRMDYRRAVQYQIHHYTRVITGEEPVYHPCQFR
jgi:CRISPR-associated protein Cas1